MAFWTADLNRREVVSATGVRLKMPRQVKSTIAAYRQADELMKAGCAFNQEVPFAERIFELTAALAALRGAAPAGAS